MLLWLKCRQISISISKWLDLQIRKNSSNENWLLWWSWIRWYVYPVMVRHGLATILMITINNWRRCRGRTNITAGVHVHVCPIGDTGRIGWIQVTVFWGIWGKWTITINKWKQMMRLCNTNQETGWDMRLDHSTHTNKVTVRELKKQLLKAPFAGKE